MKSDCISRAAAMKAVHDYGIAAIDEGRTAPDETADDIIEIGRLLEALPAADEPEAEWLEDDTTFSGVGLKNNLCSACGQIAGTWRAYLPLEKKWAYCPNCGAKMRCNLNS